MLETLLELKNQEFSLATQNYKSSLFATSQTQQKNV